MHASRKKREEKTTPFRRQFIDRPSILPGCPVMHARTTSQSYTDEQAWGSKANSVCMIIETAQIPAMTPAACVNASLLQLPQLISMVTNKQFDCWSLCFLELDTRESPHVGSSAPSRATHAAWQCIHFGQSAMTWPRCTHCHAACVALLGAELPTCMHTAILALTWPLEDRCNVFNAV